MRILHSVIIFWMIIMDGHIATGAYRTPRPGIEPGSSALQAETNHYTTTDLVFAILHVLHTYRLDLYIWSIGMMTLAIRPYPHIPTVSW